MTQGTQIWCCHNLEGWDVGGSEVQEGGDLSILMLIHVDVWQKPTKYYEVIILQLKLKIKFKNICNIMSVSVKGHENFDKRLWWGWWVLWLSEGDQRSLLWRGDIWEEIWIKEVTSHANVGLEWSRQRARHNWGSVHRARHFPGSSVVKNAPASVGDAASIPGSGSSPGKGCGNPLQYSCLENPMTEDPGGLPSLGLRTVGCNGACPQTHSCSVAGAVWRKGVGT